MPLLLGGSKCSAWATSMGQRGCAVPCFADRAGDQDPREVSCSAVEQPSTLWHSSEALSFPHCLISSGSSEPHLLVKQVQHLAIILGGGKSAQICLNCCCRYLTQIIFLTEVGLTHPQHSLVGKLPAVCTAAKAWACRFPAIAVRWGFHTSELSVYEQKDGHVTGAPEPPFPAFFELAQRFQGWPAFAAPCWLCHIACSPTLRLPASLPWMTWLVLFCVKTGMFF